MKIFKTLRKILLITLVLFYIIFEYFVWDLVVYPVVEYISKFKIYTNTLNYVSKFNKYVILIVFVNLFILSEVLGVVALALFTKGLILASVMMYILKYLPAVLAFALLDYNKPKLLSISWFKVIYDFINTIITKIKVSSTYLNIVSFSTNIKNTMKTAIKIYFDKPSKFKRMFIYIKDRNKI